MYKKVKDFILGLKNYGPDLKIAVSYSGGADSGVLLHLINELHKEKLVAEPSVIYFNHGLRGLESEDEENFVKKVCSDCRLELLKIKLNVKEQITSKITLETAARNLRYEHYARIAEKFDLIAQGHHSDDNAETVFFNILRGSGLDGASGIKEKRGIFIRPLLSFCKDEIMSFAKENGIPFLTDSTNMKNDFTRNKIRNIIFPLIRTELNREISGSLNSFSEIVRETGEIIEEIVDQKSKKILRVDQGLSIIKLNCFKALKPALQKAILRRAFGNAGIIYNADRIKTSIILNRILKDVSSVFATDEYSVSVHRNNILIMNCNKYENNLKISLSKKRKSPLYIDQSSINGDIRIRKVLPSDNFIPFGGKSKVKISKVLSDKKVPKKLRDSMLCLEDDEKIIYVQGAGISDAVKTQNDSVVTYINENNNILKKLFK